MGGRAALDQVRGPCRSGCLKLAPRPVDGQIDGVVVDTQHATERVLVDPPMGRRWQGAVLLVGQPTRGFDIGAIEFIHQQIVALRDAGKAILLVSVELDEIMSLSDRIVVMFDGRLMGERQPDETSETELGLMMAGIAEGMEGREGTHG